MHNHIADLLKKDMSRKEFLVRLGFGTATLVGFGTLIKALTGRSAVNTILTGDSSSSADSIVELAAGGTVEALTAAGVTILDYGAKCDANDTNTKAKADPAATDDTDSIKGMISALGYAVIPAYRSSAVRSIVLEKTQMIIMNPGSRLIRTADSTDTSPLVTLTSNHCSILGLGGTLQVLNSAPNGIIRFDHSPVSTCEWCRVNGVRIIGPDKDLPGNYGILFSAPLPPPNPETGIQGRPTATFQNRCSDITISQVETGVRLEEGANVNQISTISLHNIGKTVFDLDNAIESSISNVTVSASPGATVIRLSNTASYNNFSALAVEPGTKERVGEVWIAKPSTGYVIDAECNYNIIQGIINTSYLGTDSGIGNAISTQRTNEINRMLISTVDYVAKTKVSSFSGTALQADEELWISLSAGTYVVSGEIYYTADTAADMKLQLNVNANLKSGAWSAQGLGITSTTSAGTMICASTSFGGTVSIGGNGQNKTCVRIGGRLVVSANCKLSVSFAQNTANTINNTVFSISWLRVERTN